MSQPPPQQQKAPNPPVRKVPKIKAAEVPDPEHPTEDFRNKFRAKAHNDRNTPPQPLPDANPKPTPKKEDESLGNQFLAAAKKKLLPDFFSVPEEEKSANRKKFDQLPLGKQVLVAFLWNDNIPGGKALAKNLFPKVHPQPSDQKAINAAINDPVMSQMFKKMHEQGLSPTGKPTGNPATFTFKPDPENKNYKNLSDDQKKALKGVEIKVSSDKVACNKTDKNNVDAFTKTVAAFSEARKTADPKATPLTVTGQKPKYEKLIEESAARTGKHSVFEMTAGQKALQPPPPPPPPPPSPAQGPKMGQHRG